jgi:hypothetical protein
VPEPALELNDDPMTDDRISTNDVFDRFTERWPEAGDRLLSPGRDAFLAEGAAERSYRLLAGYKRAGDILIQHALAERYDCDNLFLPALFRAMPNDRCRLHGGKSTGAKTPEGKARQVAKLLLIQVMPRQQSFDLGPKKYRILWFSINWQQTRR